MPMVGPVFIAQESHALSCQTMKIFCSLSSLGASYSGRDYMDARALAARNASELAENRFLKIQQAAAF